MKVLLMVEREGRVVCAAWWEAAWEKALMAVVNGDPFSSIQFHSFNAVRRSGTPWKLVKADNAEAARATIEALTKGGATARALPVGIEGVGRILASGGRS